MGACADCRPMPQALWERASVPAPLGCAHAPGAVRDRAAAYGDGAADCKSGTRRQHCRPRQCRHPDEPSSARPCTETISPLQASGCGGRRNAAGSSSHKGKITVVAAAGLTGEGSSAGTRKACGHDWLQELWNRCRPTGIGGNRRRSSSRPRRAARIGSARENYALASRWGQAPHRWRPSGERLRPAKALQRASRPGR